MSKYKVTYWSNFISNKMNVKGPYNDIFVEANDDIEAKKKAIKKVSVKDHKTEKGYTAN
ncbi:hypothetical protein AB8U03_16630 [Clostridium sp. Mt-5]|uniref:Uncharacterized protein n=1 Tax=Clostridium moutaii TaxID=3240932 RepID=A0ABV4BSP5_9CLOT